MCLLHFNDIDLHIRDTRVGFTGERGHHRLLHGLRRRPDIGPGTQDDPQPDVEASIGKHQYLTAVWREADDTAHAYRRARGGIGIPDMVFG